MERIINEVTKKLKREFCEFFAGKETDVRAAEAYFSSRIAEATLELLRCYYEKLDCELREDKAGRKQAGITVERRGEKREILLLLGPLEYRRTYYKKASGGYEYPVDRIAGVDAYEWSARESACRWWKRAARCPMGRRVRMQPESRYPGRR